MGDIAEPILAQFFKGDYRHIEILSEPSNISYIQNSLAGGNALMQFGFALPKNVSSLSYQPFERVSNSYISTVTLKTKGAKPKSPIETSTVTARIMTSNRVGSNDGLNEQYSRNVQALDDKISQSKSTYLKLVSDNYARVAKIPPLVLLVNPERLVTSYEQSSDLAVGRRSHIVSNWLEKPIELTAEGSTLGFYSFAPNGSDESAGITNAYRVNSLSYGNLMSLLAMYLDNANMTLQGATDHSVVDIPVAIFNIYLYYDNTYYLGSFDTFGISESADKPHSLRYNFTFHARYCYKL